MAVTVPFAIAVAVAAVVLFAVGPSHAQETDCQRIREHDQSSNSGLVHQCDEDGNFVPLQSLRDSNRKVCVTPKEGDVVVRPSRYLQTCVCPLARHSAMSEGKGAIPRCDDAGRFRPLQRDGNRKTCVDPNTGDVTKGPVPADRRINC